MASITSTSPKLTAVKVIAALGRLEDYKPQDSYLIVPFKSLISEDEREQMKQLLVSATHSLHLLVIVCGERDSVTRDEFTSLETLIPDEGEEQKGKRKKGIFIVRNDGAIKADDECNFKDLNEESKKKTLDKYVTFQDKQVRVGDLIPKDSGPSNDLFNELLLQENKVVIPSPHSDESRVNKSLYIERSLNFMNFPLHLDHLFWKDVAGEMNKNSTKQTQQTEESLQKQFRVHPNGSIDWQVKDEKSQKQI